MCPSKEDGSLFCRCGAGTRGDWGFQVKSCHASLNCVVPRKALGTSRHLNPAIQNKGEESQAGYADHTHW
ncbi:hypothetical protein E2C01_068306 [Portunus trituberculatus]|uniref:Uncharacterized protein n=1 Tax=Portunus trituberculatus TaxID=210409 RepID=A0A5B7HRK4_PORTR|nr:hypothetical protein [Portunus trituberculatus]